MKISARNVIRGKIKAIKRGGVNGEVVMEIAGGQEVVSISTLAAIDDLNLQPGQEVYAVFRASDTMVAISHSKRGA